MVTQRRLDKAAAKVKAELKQLGFWTARLDDVEIQLIPFAWSTLGLYDNGVIQIPAVTLLRPFSSLQETLRHEYGHALYEQHKGILRRLGFTRIFGAYESTKRLYRYDQKCFVSRYAAKRACEDFAETFATFVRCRGMLPARASYPAIQEKWEFIQRLQRRFRGL